MSFWSFSGMFLKPLFAGVSDTYGRKSILMMPDTVDFVARIALIPLLSAAGKPSTAAVRVLVTGLLIGGTCGSCGVPMWNCALVRLPFSACPAPDAGGDRSAVLVAGLNMMRRFCLLTVRLVPLSVSAG